MKLFFQTYKKNGLSDAEIVEGIQNSNERVTKSFYDACATYYDNNWRAVLMGNVMPENEKATTSDDLFIESFEHLWTEIDNRKIFVKNGQVFRLNKDGVPLVMTSNLTTFLMSIAKNKCRELFRIDSNEYPDDFMNVPVEDDVCVVGMDQTDSEVRMQVVDDCLSQLHKRCKDILTMFYVKEMSLDEILSVREENFSKDGLKTSKNKCLNTLRFTVKKECERRRIAI